MLPARVHTRDVIFFVCKIDNQRKSMSRRNSLVSTSPLTRDQREKIQNLFIKPFAEAKHGMFKSKARPFFGHLYYTEHAEHDDGILLVPHVPHVLLDGSKLYCRLCLEQQQRLYSEKKMGHISKVVAYSPSTSTTTMSLHLAHIHDVINVEGSGSKQSKLCFSSESKPSAAKTAQELNRDLVIWACTDLLPFDFVEKSGLQNFFRKNFPDYRLPSEATLRSTALLDVYRTLKGKIIKELEEISTICIMFDGWTDRHHAYPFIGLRISYITPDWISKVVTLSCKVLCSHTAEAIADHVQKELHKFFSERRVNMFSTHDGARNVVKASRLLRVEQYHHCVAHALHLLLMTDAMNRVEEVRNIIQRCKEIVNTLHFKGPLLMDEVENEKDREVMALLEIKISRLIEDNDLDEENPILEDDESNDSRREKQTRPKSLKAAVATRWNSCLSMMSSILELFGEVNETLKRIGQRDLCLSSAEKELLSELHLFLGNFKEFTDLVSGSQPHLGLVLMIKQDINRLVNETSREEHPAIEEVKELIKAKLDDRLKITDSVKIASLLDPSIKDFIQMTNIEKTDVLVHACERHPITTPSTETGQRVDSSDDSHPHCSKRQKLLERFRASFGRDVAQGQGDLQVEVSRYLSLPVPELGAVTQHTPIEFWKSNNDSYPH